MGFLLGFLMHAATTFGPNVAGAGYSIYQQGLHIDWPGQAQQGPPVIMVNIVNGSRVTWIWNGQYWEILKPKYQGHCCGLTSRGAKNG